MGIGGAWLAFLLLAYFIPVLDDSGANYQVYDSLLGIIIFHNLLVLLLYVLLSIAFIAYDLRKHIAFV